MTNWVMVILLLQILALGASTALSTEKSWLTLSMNFVSILMTTILLVILLRKKNS